MQAAARAGCSVRAAGTEGIAARVASAVKAGSAGTNRRFGLKSLARLDCAKV
jgi:hypothetical protein